MAWVVALGAVEVVVPERLLVASEAQAPQVCGLVIGGDAAVKEALVTLLRHAVEEVVARARRRRIDIPLESAVVPGEDRRTSTVTNALPETAVLFMFDIPRKAIGNMPRLLEERAYRQTRREGASPREDQA
ncbi:MAG: hypothetical protein ABIS06_10545 [Vicinamibacterales bacterium]